MTVTCLSCGAEYGQPHAANCEFTLAAAPGNTGGNLTLAAGSTS